MLKEKIGKALNEQIHMELASAYTYLAMVAWFEEQGFSGFAHWMRLQANEEVNHAMRLFGFVNERSGRVHLETIEKPPADYTSPLNAFEHALAHERKVTESIHNLYELAMAERDYPTQTHLHWFINEQVEEENTAEDAVTRLRLAGDNPSALMILDKEFGSRRADDDD